MSRRTSVHALYAAIPPVTPSRIRTDFSLGRRVVRDLPAGDLFHRHRQVVLGAGLDQRRRGFVEADSLTELVVVVVDLTGALGRDDDERVARFVRPVEQRVDAWM